MQQHAQRPAGARRQQKTAGDPEIAMPRRVPHLADHDGRRGRTQRLLHGPKSRARIHGAHKDDLRRRQPVKAQPRRINRAALNKRHLIADPDHGA